MNPPSDRPGPGSVHDEIERSRREVLDLSLRNPLLNFRLSKRRGVEVVDELSREVFRILVRAERTMYFLPAEDHPELHSEEELAEVSAELVAFLDQPAGDSRETQARHSDNKLQTRLSRAVLNQRLRETFRQARSSIEEQGINVLHIALGTLKWFESDSSNVERKAPLILVPVQLNRTDIRGSVRVSWTRDDLEANLSLKTKLRQDFGLRLPEMPDADDLDVEEYLSRIEAAIAGMEGWSVARDEIHLNFFEFSKLLIYKDLDPDTWPDDSRPADHAVVRRLYGAEDFAGTPAESGGGGSLDAMLDEYGLHQVLDADSSQTKAIVDAIEGHDLVIQGPPGTGKSQTITNLLAEAVARGRTVLFVAEKLAALNVVKRRMDSIHLGEACLELHSHKTSKRAVLDELNRTRSLGCPQAEGGEADGILLQERRSRLNGYARAVNTPVMESGLTPNELVGRMEQLVASGLPAELRLSVGDSESWTGADFTLRREQVGEIEALVREIGVPRNHIFRGSGLLRWLPTEERRAGEALDRARRQRDRVKDAVHRLGMALGWNFVCSELSLDELELRARSARLLAEVPDLSHADPRSPLWFTRATELTELARSFERYAAARAKYEDRLIPEAWDADVLETRLALQSYGDKWWRGLFGRYRRARDQVRGLCRDKAPPSPRRALELVDAILSAQRNHRHIEDSRALLSRVFPGVSPGIRGALYGALAHAAAWLVRLHAGRRPEDVHGAILDLLDSGADGEKAAAAAEACLAEIRRLREAHQAVIQELDLRLERYSSQPPPWEGSFGALEQWLDAARSALASVRDIVRFNQLAERATAGDMAEVVELATHQEEAPHHLVALFDHGCYSRWLEAALRERPELAEFRGRTHDDVVEGFRELDEAEFHHNRTRVARRHWDQLPRGPGGGQLGVLFREFNKKRRHLPVRKLMTEAGQAIQGIKPVFMMSPLSIAKYIPPGSVTFDMVVFDEASQVKPVEALGAILRGRQCVVVGDDRQLPPTAFFDRLGAEGDDEASEMADIESILGMFSSRMASGRMLRFHYRSRHESLIAVSNREFYDDRLFVFPSPDAEKSESGLALRHCPENSYERGKGVNKGEARAVASEVMEHARRTPELTLGVAAFSLAQARRIEDAVEVERHRDPSCEEFFRAHPDEPFFVKNLENVQGDERDVILISIGYGKIEGGFLPMNFGPLNREGGERRLNVLITRAKRRCVVFCNFTAADLDLRRSKARGVRALRTFLDYAETGTLDGAAPTGRGADSPFEEAVAEALRRRGHDIVHQVGSAGFFIDLAVVDPDRPGRFLLGIECDGATYHSAEWARDRDRLRQQALEGLGWRFHRIWSTDWFRDRRSALEETEAAIDLARRGGPPGPPAPPAPAEPLDRREADESEAPDPVRPYELAQLLLDPPRPSLAEMELGVLAGWLAQVVDAESPVHMEEASIRIRKALGGIRNGARIRRRMSAAARWGAEAALFEVSPDDFLWRTGLRDVEIRRRDAGSVPGSLRNAEMIAPEEIGCALIHVVRTSYGIREKEAVVGACRLIGYERCTAKISARFLSVVHALVEGGTLKRDGDFLQTP